MGLIANQHRLYILHPLENMPRVTTASQDLADAQASLENAKQRVSKCHNHVEDDRAYLASVSDPRNTRSAQTSTVSSWQTTRSSRTNMRVVKKAQQGLRKWEELLAEAQTTLQERTRNLGHVRERVAREQALR